MIKKSLIVLFKVRKTEKAKEMFKKAISFYSVYRKKLLLR